MWEELVADPPICPMCLHQHTPPYQHMPPCQQLILTFPHTCLPTGHFVAIATGDDKEQSVPMSEHRGNGRGKQESAGNKVPGDGVTLKVDGVTSKVSRGGKSGGFRQSSRCGREQSNQGDRRGQKSRQKTEGIKEDVVTGARGIL